MRVWCSKRLGQPAAVDQEGSPPIRLSALRGVYRAGTLPGRASFSPTRLTAGRRPPGALYEEVRLQMAV